jgi:hypothetical protein
LLKILLVWNTLLFFYVNTFIVCWRSKAFASNIYFGVARANTSATLGYFNNRSFLIVSAPLSKTILSISRDIALIVPRWLRIISRSRPSTCGFNSFGTEFRKVFVMRSDAYFSSRAWLTKPIKCFGQLCKEDCKYMLLFRQLTSWLSICYVYGENYKTKWELTSAISSQFGRFYSNWDAYYKSIDGRCRANPYSLQSIFSLLTHTN